MQNIQTRHPTRDDLPALASFANTIAQLDVGLPAVTSVEALQQLWDNPDIDLSRDMLLVVDRDGNIVGNLSALLLPPYTQVYQEINLHPIYRNRGLEDFLLERAEEHARANADVAPPDTPLRIVHGIYDRQTWLKTLLENNGYALYETVQSRVVTSTTPPPIPDLPPGVVLRPYVPAADAERLVGMLREIAQHYPSATLPTVAVAGLDPSLVFLAHQGAAVVAVVVANGDGVLTTIAERPQWADSGALLAVLRTAQRALFQRGVTTMQFQLHNPAHFPFTHALDASGMHPHHTSLIYAKRLRAAGPPAADTRD